MIGGGKGNVYEVKIKMYYLMKQESDLLIVLDLQCERCKYVQILNGDKKMLFKFGV